MHWFPLDTLDHGTAQSGEERTYYKLGSSECIVTRVPPRSTQPWHRHQYITEAYIVVEGEVVLHEGDTSQVARQGDLVVLPPNDLLHTLENATDRWAVTFTVKLINADGYPPLFASDKVVLDIS